MLSGFNLTNILNVKFNKITLMANACNTTNKKFISVKSFSHGTLKIFPFLEQHEGKRVNTDYNIKKLFPKEG